MGQFPTAWKHAYVLPIHKSGDRHDVMNYKPISILSTFSKLFDCIVSRKLAEFLWLHIARQQHGFLKGRSTVTNLLLFNNFVMSSLENHTQVDVIYSDFSKAFDTVNHHRLLDKLWNVGFCGALHKWIYSYLSNRSQSVRVLNCISNSVVISSGVPQGSHLGPILFNIYINDVVNVIKTSSSLIYADDLKIFRQVGCPLDVSQLQRDLHRVEKWSYFNGLRMNQNNCKVMSYHRWSKSISFDYILEGIPVHRVTSISDLDVVHDASLSFTDQILQVAGKALRTLGFIRRSTDDFRHKNSQIALFKSLVLPHLTYASVIWSPTYEIHFKPLESVLHSFLRLLASKSGHPMHYFDHDYSPLISAFNLPSIRSTHSYHDHMCAFKILNQLFSSPDVNSILSP